MSYPEMSYHVKTITWTKYIHRVCTFVLRGMLKPGQPYLLGARRMVFNLESTHTPPPSPPQLLTDLKQQLI